jgi:TolA-binding protein
MRSLLIGTTTGAVLLLFAGCTNMTMLRTQELRAIQSKVDSLSTEMVTWQKKSFEEQKAQGEMLRLMRADQQIRFNELDRKVAVIDGGVSESQMQLSKINEKTAQVQKKIDARLSADSVNESSKNSDAEKLFQIAMSDFNAGRFDISISSFNDLILKCPGSPIAQDAEYWISECLYAKKEYVEAEKGYLSYIKKYPQGNKMCVSLYKVGLVYDKQNKEKYKNMVWKKLVEQCPDSQEAKVVQAQAR